MSAVALLAVLDAPEIFANPVDRIVCEGDSVTLSVTAIGTKPLNYTWRKDGADIPGANASSYSIAAAAAEDTASYDVVISDVCGTTTSEAALLTVSAALEVTQDPVDQTVCGGEPVTLTVVATGAEPLSYQWRQDGADIPDANAASYSITWAIADDAGSYDVVITSFGCEAVSQPATLVVEDCGTPFRRPDSNGDGRVDISDAIFTLGFLFLGDGGPSCIDTADANDDGTLDVADPIFTLQYLLLGTAPPPPPLEECGRDPTLDNLGCESYTPCMP
jgi:hypothetical protein